MASGQNPDIFYFFHFSPKSRYIAIPDGSIPGAAFKTALQITGGFCLDSRGDVWAGLDRTNHIYHYSFNGFDSDGKPSWRPATTIATPESVRPTARIVYLPASDTMILAQGLAGNWDWTAMNGRIEVYHGWTSGNIGQPAPVITLASPNPKSIAAAGDYLFAGYVHTVPNIDVFDLNTGQLVTTLVNANPDKVDVGNDVDSMYGRRAYLRADGEYVITRDNYKGTSVIVHRWTP